jgi:hypothetical protein
VSDVVTLDPPEGWVLAGRGSFHRVPPDAVEARGGPGVLWYPGQELADFTLLVDWRLSSPTDNSGVFIRIPSLAADDWKPAASRGYEIQIDDRGIDYDAGTADSPLHRTGAIYERAPATVRASRPAGDWNTFGIEVRGSVIAVSLNGTLVSRLEDSGIRRTGHVGLQAHDERSRVQFRNIRIRA